MTDYRKLYDGITKVAWGYFFLYFHINLGSVNILPDFVGYLLFLSAIRILEDEERDLALLRTLGILLAVWHGALWLGNCFSIDLDEKAPFLATISCLVNLYFHFQLLTNIASIAAKYQPAPYEQDGKLLKYRTVQTVMLTGIMILSHLSPWFGETWIFVSFGTGLVYIIVCICIMKALFDLRRCLQIANETTDEFTNETI